MGEGLSPDEIIQELGGCGRYQWRMNILMHLTKLIVVFSGQSLLILTYSPSWSCIDDTTSFGGGQNTRYDIGHSSEEGCFFRNTTTPCNDLHFEGKANTLVTEYQLVCEQDFIPSTIHTIELAGAFAGNIIAGQLGDLIGRKPPYFSAIVMFLVFNLVGFFSVNWIMFAVARFFIGMGMGFFYSTIYPILSEFTQAKWRSWSIGMPTHALEACLFALISWQLQDWRFLQLMNAIVSVPFMFTWWCIPESFRWLIAKQKPNEAKAVIQRVAEYNKINLGTNLDHLVEEKEHENTRTYTFLDILKTPSLFRIMVLLTVIWGTQNIVAFSLHFGIQSLAGNIFFNTFLFNIVTLPSRFLAAWMQNRFGRRIATVLCFILMIGCSLTVGIIQSVDAPHKDKLVTAFALVAFLCNSTAWSPLQTWSIELFPTVVRNVSFGSLGSLGRLFSLVGPPLVYANLHVPGVMYYACAGVMVISTVACCFLPETKDRALEDTIAPRK